ncbi:restriction endonuclease subunit S [Pseudoalteromonas sp. SR44-5]|uniref:restriction endonuclease subunit S n=1 Tax=unclassified Pseudoalteromonas TaxID=194690 RepID=UPI0016026620|nr:MULTISPECIES: restriction endonuclease subunit S [unclassified Pseudoalteromonas]MBB1364991.1 restriction endonuclease subunit S [Pseudoalteromonas sp. SR44-5]MBB1468120.1 restriction endonuclease subunit S [Pseudoalteromonas sp. SG41-5]
MAETKAPNTSAEQLITEHLDIWTTAIEQKSSSGRGSSKKFSLHGIKKLRELILELAVRGKLVPQDPNDEPASVLLERIAAEKAQLVKDKKIKKPKALPEISEDEKPFELPKGWEWTRLQDIIQISSGKNLTSKKMVQGGDVPVYGGNGITGYHDTYNVSSSTLVIGRVGFYCGSVHITPDSAWVTDNAFITRFDEEGLFIEFLYWLFKNTNLSKNDSATAQPVISGSKVYPIVVAIPPTKEQQRIVAKVDELMSLCDALEAQTENSITAHQTLVEVLLEALLQSPEQGATPEQTAEQFQQNWHRLSEHFDTLFTTIASIDTLKQTILQLAVMGKLVPQNPNDEPAAKLLERIAAEKAQLIKDKKIKKQKPLPAITDEEKPFELPRGWEWCRVWDVAELITSGSRDWAKYYSDSGAIFVTMGNLARGDYRLRLDNLRYVSPPIGGEGSRTSLMKDDLLISITGDVGNLGLIPEGFGEAYINQHTCLLRFMSECRNRYFPELMRSPLASFQFNAPQRGIKNSFRLGDVGEMIIPLPPLCEQNQIVAKVDELMALCDQLKARLTDAQTTKFHLTDAIVENSIN